MSLKEKMQFKIPCPKCSNPVVAHGSDVGSTVTCPNCGANIKLLDNNFTAGINEVDNMLKNMFKH